MRCLSACLVRAAVGASLSLFAVMPGHASPLDRARHKSGAVIEVSNQQAVRGTLTAAQVKVGGESGAVTFDDQLAGTVTSKRCVIAIKPHGQDYDDGWIVKATDKDGQRPCPGVPDGVYRTF